MKALLTYNRAEEPVVLLELETQKERDLFKNSPSLFCRMSGFNGDVLANLTYEIREMTLLDDISLGGILFTDHLHVETCDGTCSRCRQVIGEAESPFRLWADEGVAMYLFCQRCAHDPTSDRCRVCGCTEVRGCESICSWQAPGLCSNCDIKDIPLVKTGRAATINAGER